jgi:hypothetical protein
LDNQYTLHRISIKLVDFCNLAELWWFSVFPAEMWWFFGINSVCGEEYAVLPLLLFYSSAKTRVVARFEYLTKGLRHLVPSFHLLDAN